VTAGAPALRLGLLSTAAINRVVLDAAAASDRAEVAAVASRSPERARAYAFEHGIGRWFGAYEGLLGDPEVDAVYVSAPNSLHVEWSVRALAAGKHVLCEKPFHSDPADVERAFDAAERAGLVLMEAFQFRHHPQTAEVVRLLRAGAIGKLRLIRSFLGFTVENGDDIRLRPELDGGSFLDAGCYTVNVARLLAGEPERAIGEQVLGPSGVDVGFAGTLRFAEGVVAQVGSSFAVPRRRELELIGSTGSMRVHDPFHPHRSGAIEIERDGGVERIEAASEDAYRLQLENFADAAAGRAEPALGRRDAVGQSRALAALYRSAREGAAVELTPPHSAARTATRASRRGAAP
jgi:D-xylose 1-dehydrogenase (NADP+, D-xylono-1,5-lactone-forming)